MGLSVPFLDVCCVCSRLFLRRPFQVAHANFGTRFTYYVNRMHLQKEIGLKLPLSSCLTEAKRPSGCFNPAAISRARILAVTSCSQMFSTQQQPHDHMPPKKKSIDQSKKSPISWKTLLIVAGLGGAFAIGMHMVKKEKEEEIKKSRTKQMGKALLGGDWTLTDHHGNRRSSKEFRGQWILIYFGFTNCPDICPEEIEKIVRVINQTDADKDLPEIQPIVITVDPERDTPEALKEYCGEFSPRLLGFTGTVEEITAATRAYRVYFSAGPKDEDNDYIVDHSIISYLVNPHGEFVDYFGQNKTSAEIYKSIKLHISSYYVAEKKRG
ncbi:SCO1-like protein, mitochondrial [Elysia marginata]|uniref:SCO1-like protein, mitochondrial n=1 Tax=Elysia marginata TaxID=1093978 RepID=A0AAV4H5U6_9GAST|nr:SCO1-like protein, mitochondrial [Elysia marginata]